MAYMTHSSREYAEAGVDVSRISLVKNNGRCISDENWERTFGKNKERICPICKKPYEIYLKIKSDGTCEHR